MAGASDTRTIDPETGSISVSADGRTWVFDPADSPVSIGRDDDADVVLDGDLVSRQHAELRVEDDGWVLEDLASRNGIVVDGAPIERRIVSKSLAAWLGGRQGTELRLTTSVTSPMSSSIGDRSSVATATLAQLGDAEPIGHYSTTGTAVVTFGRDRDNDVVIDDLMVSRHHAQVRTDLDGERMLVDLGSHNGTFVNGARVPTMPSSRSTT